MLELAEPNPMQTLDAARAQGGFLWWYTDLRSAAGDGLVIIWSLGLPFLPGARNSLSALSRPAVSLAHYVDGKQHLYLLQQYRRQDAQLDLLSGNGSVGRSTYHSTQSGAEFEVAITLDEPIPYSAARLTGQVLVRGTGTGLKKGESTGAHHVWAPRTAHAQGSAILHYGGESHQLEGSAYVDSNVSNTPLHSQGIQSWRWGRITFPDYTLIYYELESDEGARLRYLYRQDPGESLVRLAGRLSFERAHRGKYGLSSPQVVLIGSRGSFVWAEVSHAVEDGPFYARGLLRAQDHVGNTGFGFCETVVPKMIDKAWQRPLVRMRTHQIGKDNSPFLPLFSGPKADRAARLLSAFSWKGAVA